MAKRKIENDENFVVEHDRVKVEINELAVEELKDDLISNILETKVEQRDLPTWEQIRDKLASVSAMKFEMTGQRITHGDAIAIFKTDSHRKLYEAWVRFKSRSGDPGS